MNATAWMELAFRLTVVAVWLAVRAVLLLAQGGAHLMAALLPTATSSGGALGQALTTAGLWTAVGAALGLLSGEPAGIVAGGGLGAVVGGLAAIAVARRGEAQVRARGGAVALGERAGMFGVPQPHVIPRAARVRHLAVFGPTGAGKSTVLKNLVRQDATAPGRPGLLVVDVKDDLVLDIAAHLPGAEAERVLLFDPADTAFPPAFNPLAGVDADGRTLAAAEIIAALRRLYAEAWGPRLEHVLRMAVLTLLETPGATLLDLVRLLTDAPYRAWATAHVTNVSVRAFWEREWPAITGARGSLANVESILNKLSIFAYPEIRNVLGQGRRGLDLGRAMAEGQIVLAHLPQGVLGEDATHFLAALLVGTAQLAAQRRVALAQRERRPFYLVADEFQNYDTGAFTKLITEGRSMGVGLVAACQFREQLPSALRLALERNCAYALECRLVGGKHSVQVLKLQEPDAPDAAVLVRSFPPPHDGSGARIAAVRERSRRALARPRAEVEAAIAARLAPPAPAEEDPVAAEAGSQGSFATNGTTRRPKADLTKEAGYGRFFE